MSPADCIATSAAARTSRPFCQQVLHDLEILLLVSHERLSCRFFLLERLEAPYLSDRHSAVLLLLAIQRLVGHGVSPHQRRRLRPRVPLARDWHYLGLRKPTLPHASLGWDEHSVWSRFRGARQGGSPQARWPPRCRGPVTARQRVSYETRPIQAGEGREAFSVARSTHRR